MPAPFPCLSCDPFRITCQSAGRCLQYEGPRAPTGINTEADAAARARRLEPAEGFFYYVIDAAKEAPLDLDLRYSTVQSCWIVRSRSRVDGFMPLEYDVVRTYMKVGY
jgi:hypothetical protein